MNPIKKILVPYDFGAASAEAVDYALELAAQTSAEVVLLHVYELPVYGDRFMGAGVPDRISGFAQAALDAAVVAHMSSAVKVRGLLREGSPWREVNDVAEEIGADLIVMGTHGRRGLSRALLGSVAEKVVRTATRPVLTVRESGAQELQRRAPTAPQPLA